MPTRSAHERPGACPWRLRQRRTDAAVSLRHPDGATSASIDGRAVSLAERAELPIGRVSTSERFTHAIALLLEERGSVDAVVR
jgi:hypothetical protein